MALLLMALSPRAAAVRRSSWSSSVRTSALSGSVDVSFFLYARSVRHVCSVDMLRVPNPLLPRRFGDDFLRDDMLKAGREGRRVILDRGLGGGLN